MKLFIFAFKCLRQLFIQRAAQDGDEGGWVGGGAEGVYFRVRRSNEIIPPLLFTVFFAINNDAIKNQL